MFKTLFESLNPWEHIQSWLLELGKDVVLSSQYICVIAGMIGLILYLFGLKKGKTVASVSPIAYIIIRIIGSVILGV